jgi:hypothetical protein
VTISLDGYESWEKAITVTEDALAQQWSYNPVLTPLPVQTTTLRFKSTPSGASVYFDGELVGTTPTAVSGIELGSHDVTISLDGYESWEKAITVTEDALTQQWFYKPSLKKIH